MTERKFQYTIKKIGTCREQGYYTEALIRNYHLNLDVIRYILSTCVAEYSVKDKKIKTIVNDFISETMVNAELNSILNKKNLKIVKPWLEKMEVFFKTIKHKLPANTRLLQQETEKITGLLNISLIKLLNH